MRAGLDQPAVRAFLGWRLTDVLGCIVVSVFLRFTGSMMVTMLFSTPHRRIAKTPRPGLIPANLSGLQTF
ncbi:MAG: hypothetical protein KTR25_12885 [Myxococcales bacterium]|nr:hypothetical protein [Myxococcales bacterium]